jgi:hypothetical protein
MSSQYDLNLTILIIVLTRGLINGNAPSYVMPYVVRLLHLSYVYVSLRAFSFQKLLFRKETEQQLSFFTCTDMSYHIGTA